MDFLYSNNDILLRYGIAPRRWGHIACDLINLNQTFCRLLTPDLDT